MERHRRQLRARCLKRYGRRPGQVTDLFAQAGGPTTIDLSIGAVGTNGGMPPPALGFVVKQSQRPIRTDRDFRRAQTLCEGSCNFPDAGIPMNAVLVLIIGDLLRNTTYYYAVAARDNVSCLLGPRSRTVQATTGPVPLPPPRPLDTQIDQCKD
jgi:hypothetical protein